MAVSVLWLIFAIFFPIVLYYVTLKLSLAVDRHVRHKKEIYASLEAQNDVLKEFKDFPTNTIIYYIMYLSSGGALFFIDFYYPLNLQTLYIPAPTLIALIVNFFFLVVLVDVISKRFYTHQEMEKEIHEKFSQNNTWQDFKRRSGLSFMVFSFLTLGVYIYIYLFLINGEYVRHVMNDYSNVRRLFEVVKRD